MPARSLLAMSTRIAIQYSRSLTDVGNIPYPLARPFLIKIESPAQLREIERNSPHIMEDDRELWIDFIKRDVPQWDQYELPEESACWYDIYSDLVERVQREVDEDALRLKQAVDKINSDKASNAAVFVRDTSILPKPRRRAPTRTEPKKSGLFHTKRNRVLAVPTHRLNSGASQIRHVPQWLVDQHKQPTTVTQQRPSSASAPKTSASGVTGHNSSTSNISPKPPGRPQPVQLVSRSTVSPAKSQTALASRPVLSAKRPSEDRPARVNTGPQTSDRPSLTRPLIASPAPPLIKRRAISSQPNVFIQQKKRKA
ncbi:putative RNA polymerase II transcription factor SIII subunit A [Talaromyces proteolyticus]|uniref:RNA polymerase II transcription factor SIII subunit A n=1 Tax=Talaromyces proteolyticus TaxID=1131652 RepID=A0AAD4KP41_9EURO|nr:putative RNA polymerase II transcription factor SIII subunit A [Talaromyces proteolyticus]KAH8695973.1 putative RNA polymerase II transcription factor SIII subunit A [Talaromyces proteolyticus]